MLEWVAHEDNPCNASWRTIGGALSVLAYHDLHIHDDYHARNLFRQADAMLFLASAETDEAASIGFHSDSGVRVAETINRRLAVREGTGAMSDLVRKDFLAFENLWKAYRGNEMFLHTHEKRRAWMKACSAGCGIEATHKSSLRACKGRCPDTAKGLYCSATCQKMVSSFVFLNRSLQTELHSKDWARHKLICRPNATLDDIFLQEDGEYAEADVFIAAHDSTTEADMHELDMMCNLFRDSFRAAVKPLPNNEDFAYSDSTARELAILIFVEGGLPIKIYSRTKSAETLKKFKAAILKALGDWNVGIGAHYFVMEVGGA